MAGVIVKHPPTSNERPHFVAEAGEEGHDTTRLLEDKLIAILDELKLIREKLDDISS